MRRFGVVCLLVAAVLLCGGGSAHAKRVALVIGNSAYENVGVLPNPASDAKALAAAFKRLGFDSVTLLNNLDNSGLRKALQAFSSTSNGADVAIVYYAGHGVEVDGRNYIIPIDAALAQKSDIEFEAIPLDSLRTSVAGASQLKMVILDACRNNPFKLASSDGKRSVSRGLARVEPDSSNEIVVYAAKEGTTANDGQGENSPFAAALIRHMETPSLDVRLMLGEVRDEVLKETGNTQEPFTYGSLGGKAVYLNAGPAKVAAADPPAGDAPKKDGLLDEAATAWVAVKDTSSVAVLKRYIERYKGTVFADLAAARLEELSVAAVPAAPADQPAEKAPDPVIASANPPVEVPPQTVTVDPFVIPVGKWAEGLRVAGNSIWVAESGAKSIAEIDLEAGKVKRRVNVGRLPVGMAADSDDTVYTLVQTDKTVWAQPAGGRPGKRIAKLVDCPNGIAVGAENIWVLTQPDCSSANSRVVRINRAGRGEAITDLLGEWGQALALGFGKVFVAHVRPPGISVIDPVTLNATHAGSGELSLWAITANSFSVYAGGRFGDDNAAGVIVEINPADGSEGRRIPVPERIAAMTSDDTIVVAVGEKGTIWLVDVGSYRIVKTITVNGGIGNPRDVIISAGRIAITDQARNGDNGAVLILQNWQEIGAE